MQNENKSFSEKFRGKELWKTINICIFFGAYTSLFIVPLFFPEFTVTLFVILAFVAISYIAIQQAVFRKMELENAGRRVLSGFVDQEKELGEEVEIAIKTTHTPSEKKDTPLIDKLALDKYMEENYKHFDIFNQNEKTNKNLKVI